MQPHGGSYRRSGRCEYYRKQRVGHLFAGFSLQLMLRGDQPGFESYGPHVDEILQRQHTLFSCLLRGVLTKLVNN